VKLGLTTDTFERPTDLGDKNDPQILYFRSYLRMRLYIGGLGVLLPLLLWIAEGPLLKGDWRVRDSLSAYYHSGARDIFVGVLCAVGLLLITYMAGKPRSFDFVLSSIAGVAALVVALLPTERPYLGEQDVRCGLLVDPLPPACTRVQQLFGEDAIARVHLGSAGLFIASLAVLCFVFAWRERQHQDHSGHGPFHIWFHVACGALIVLAVIWVFAGVDLSAGDWNFTPLYVGEVVSVLAFGASWFLKGIDLLRPPSRAVEKPTPARA
jgi:hypothetical protein